jgi:hypothetical protein
MARCAEKVVTMERRQRRPGGALIRFARERACQETATVSYTVQGRAWRYCAKHGEKRAEWARAWGHVETQ